MLQAINLGTVGLNLQSPVIDGKSKTLYVVSQLAGDLLHSKIGNDGGNKLEWKVLLNTGGAPSSVAIDKFGNIFVADLAHQAIFRVVMPRNSLSTCIKDFEGQPLRGPNSIAVDDENGYLYFTDSGPIGETSLNRLLGGVYRAKINFENGYVENCSALIENGLAHPSGIAVVSYTNNNNNNNNNNIKKIQQSSAIVYVCETMSNRIIRFVECANGVFYSSVFYQFSGAFGPISIAVHQQSGNIFVARMDFRTVNNSSAFISVISPTGELLSNIPLKSTIMSATELSGITIIYTDQNQLPDINNNNNNNNNNNDYDYLIVTESSTNSITKISISSILQI